MLGFERLKKFMGNKSEYRSAIRSRKLIRQAFMDILQECGSAKMTVTEIVRRADINRATFYAHYPDVQGVIDEIENEIIDKMFDVLRSAPQNDFLNDPKPLLVSIKSYVEDNIDSFRILVKANEALPFMEKMKIVFVEFMSGYEGLPADLRSDPRYPLRCMYFAGGLLSIYQQWLLGNLDCSLDTITVETGELIEYFASTVGK